MSISGSGLRFSGLGSGLDTDSIVSQLMAIERQPILRIQQQQAMITGRQSVLSSLRSQLSTLSSAASTLNSSNAFNPIKASSSDAAVATASAGGGAATGTYLLEISKLAQAQKVANLTAQADVDTALNLTGSFLVNGKNVEVLATDSLTSIASKINGLGAGVTAGLIDGGANKAYLTITSSETGSDSKVLLSDVNAGTVLQTLGFVSGAAAIRKPISNGAESFEFSSATDTLATMTGSNGLASTAVTVGTGSIFVSGTDTLTSLAAKINSPINGTGATATVKSRTENGTTKYYLEVTGTTTFGNEGNFLQNIGMLQRSYANELAAAQDAEFSVDGVDITSSSNTVTDAIPGVTFNLFQADASTPKKTTITLSRDTGTIKASLKKLVEAYNGITKFIKTNSSFDKETFESGPLFGDPIGAQVDSQISALIFNSVPGLSGTYTNLTQVGFKLNSSGELELDEAAMDAALAKDVDSVASLFRTVGTSSSQQLTYVAASTKTKASGTGVYAVEITQLATKGAFTAPTAQTQGNAGGELLTFGGNVFGSTPVQVAISTGLTLDDTVNLINNDARLKDYVVASNVGGFLTVTAKKYGAGGNFTLSSNMPAGPNNSGVGDGTTGFVAGVDVAGTINGEAAFGGGQFLSGSPGNATTDGLQVQYTGSTLGLAGTVKLTKGVTSQAYDLLDGFLDGVSGVFISQDKSLQSQIEQMDKSIADIEARLKIRESVLRQKFQAMEQAMNQMQAQSARMAAILNQGG